MPEMTIRTALKGDIGRCAELLAILFSQEREFSANPAAQRRGIEMVVGNPLAGKVFVCTVDGTVQGMVMLLFTVSTFLGKKVALLEDMVVDPAFRAQGIGKRLIEHAVAFARDEGFGRITLLTDHDNAPAQDFYERSGFLRSSMIVMRKTIEPGDAS